MAELLKMVNPEVDWAVTMATLRLTKKKPVVPKVTTPFSTIYSCSRHRTFKRARTMHRSLGSKPPSPKISEPSKTPLDVSPISYYVPSIDVSEGEGDADRVEGDEDEKVEGEEGVADETGIEGEKGEDHEAEGGKRIVEGVEAVKGEKIVEGVNDEVKVGGDVEVEEAEVEMDEKDETVES